ncbi:MAG: hypothetical protein ABJA87_12755 [bacterium]
MTEAGALTAGVAPALGAKVVSLRGAGLEWLLQPGGRGGTPPDAGPFVAAGLSGWDECLPTIDPCALPDGTVLPDHGSVWSVAWRPARGGWLRVDVAGTSLVFGRRIVTTTAGLRFDYRLWNSSTGPASALWAAHPQLHAPPGTRVVLSATHVVEVHPGAGLPTEWAATDSIDHVGPGRSRKFYLPADVRTGSVRLERPDGRWLRLSWDDSVVPHLGVWFDNAEYAPRPVIALEPGIGWYDSLDRAMANGSALTLPAHGAASWWLDVAVGESP